MVAPMRRSGPAGTAGGGKPQWSQATNSKQRTRNTLDNGIVRVLACGMAQIRPEHDPERPVYVISVAATLVSAHPRTLRIYEDEGLLCPARTPSNIRLYSENDIRRLTWIRHLTRDRGVNLAGIKILFELEERLGARILEVLYAEGTDGTAEQADTAEPSTPAHT